MKTAIIICLSLAALAAAKGKSVVCPSLLIISLSDYVFSFMIISSLITILSSFDSDCLKIILGK